MTFHLLLAGFMLSLAAWNAVAGNTWTSMFVGIATGLWMADPINLLSAWIAKRGGGR